MNARSLLRSHFVLLLLFWSVPLLAQGNGFSGTLQTLQDPSTLPVGPQIGAAFLAPNAIAMDTVGDVFVAECITYQTPGNLPLNNTTTTLWEMPVGTGVPQLLNSMVTGCAQGLALDPKKNLYFSSSSGNVLYELTASLGYGGTPMQLQLSPPSSFSSVGHIAMDGRGNLFVADDSAQTLTEFPMGASGVLSTYSNQWKNGSTQLNLNRIITMAADNLGNLFVFDGSNAIREMIAINGILTSTSQVVQVGAGQWKPLAITVDNRGNVFAVVTDTSYRNFLVEFASTGANSYGPVTYLADGAIDRAFSASNGLTPAESFGLSADSKGNVFVADSGNSRTLQLNVTVPADFGSLTLNSGETQKTLSFLYFDTSKTLGPLTFYSVVNGKNVPSLDFFDAGTGTCHANQGPSAPGNTCTIDVLFKPSIIGTINGLVTVTSPPNATTFSATLTGVGVAAQFNLGSGFDHPLGLAFDKDGSLLVADTMNRRIAQTGVGATVVTRVPQVVPFGSFVVDGTGNIFFADTRNNSVKELTTTGSLIALGAGWSGPRAVALDSSGSLYVTDSNNSQVMKMTRSASGIYSAPIQALARPTVYFPTGIAIDAKTQDIFVTDATTGSVIRMVTVGATAPPAPIGSGFKNPYGVAVDSFSNVFVADSGNNAIKEILAGPNNAFNQVQTVWSGGASPPKNPSAVLVDANENVFVADTGNNRVVVLTINLQTTVH